MIGKQVFNPYEEFGDIQQIKDKLKEEEFRKSYWEQCQKRLSEQKEILNASAYVLPFEEWKKHNFNSKGILSNLIISVKETIDIKGIETTGGSLLRKPHLPKKDAPSLENIRKSGAIIVAKGNIPEFATAAETNNLRFGRTNNPFDVTRTCGGSTGGDAVLVASGAVSACIGTDMAGSLRIPALFCGIVGFKPYGNALSTKGIIPTVETEFVNTMLSVGPMARSVSDCKELYYIMRGKELPNEDLDIKFSTFNQFDYGFLDQCIEQAFNFTENWAKDNFDFTSIDSPNFFNTFNAFMVLISSEFSQSFIDELNTGDRISHFSLLHESYNQWMEKPTITKALFTTLTGMQFVPQFKMAIDKAIEVLTLARDDFYKELDEKILITPAFGMIAPKHGFIVDSSAALTPPNFAKSTFFSNMMDLSTISIPDFKHIDKETKLPSSISLSCIPGNEAKLFVAAKKLEQTLRN